MTGLSIQERLYPQLKCFGCGPANPKGLQLRSFPAEGFVTASFTPWPEHDNGTGYLNGGIIATVLDCHGGAAVFHHFDQQQATLSFVTAGMDIRYLRPCPLDQPILLRARVVSAESDEIIVETDAEWDGKTRAAARARWKRWRPR